MVKDWPPKGDWEIPVVEKGVPIPPIKSRKKRNYGRRYPFPIMEVGDSFYVKCREGEHPSDLTRNLIASVRGWGMRITTRRVGQRGVRVWRIV